MDDEDEEEDEEDGVAPKGCLASFLLVSTVR